MALDTVPQPELGQIDRMGGADLVVGLLDAEHKGDAGAACGMVHEAIGQLSTAVRAVVVSNNSAGNPAPTGQPAAGDSQSSSVHYYSLPEPKAAGTPFERLMDAYQVVFAVGGRLGARACCVIRSEPRTLTPQWICRLVQPVLEMGFDLVAPRYTRLKMEGLLNRSILSPLSRALYGERVQNPMGPDFGLSGKLLDRILGENALKRQGFPIHPVASMVSTTVAGGLQICESSLGTRVQPPTNWADVSSLLAQVLGPVFLDVESNAASWQRIRGSRPVPGFGALEPASAEGGGVDVSRMLESFQLGTQTLQDVWGLVLPPGTIIELRKLSRLPAEQFRMADDLWASIVYDFVLGHRLRTISRDHLLRSMTPIYLGWIASYAIELETAGPQDVEIRLEQLSAAYEDRKPYLLSRWRWPDRFNP